MDTDNKYNNKRFHENYLVYLKAFHQYCVDNDIKYSLSGGSLLGAIRHKGFIPWDDDVDVMLTRREYNKLLSAWRKTPLEDYELFYGTTWVIRFSHKNNPLKEQESQCIDLFIFDKVPGNRSIDSIKVLMLKALQGMMKRKVDYRRYKKIYILPLFITNLLGKCIPFKSKISLYNMMSQFGKDNGMIRVYNTFFSQIGWKYSYPQSLMEEYFMVPFDGLELMATSNYHKYLSTLYGDYMTPPKMEERKPMHHKMILS